MQVREAGLLSAYCCLIILSAFLLVSEILAFLLVVAMGVTDLCGITVDAVNFARVLKLWLLLTIAFV